MGEFIDNAKGALNNAVGNANQKSADPDVPAEVADQELRGDVQNTKGKINGAIKDL